MSGQIDSRISVACPGKDDKVNVFLVERVMLRAGKPIEGRKGKMEERRTMNDPIPQPQLQDGRGHKNPYPCWERIARLIWNCVYWVFFVPVPRYFGFWHRFLLKCFGARLGKEVVVYPTVRIALPWMLTLDDAVIIGYGAILYSLGPIHIGKHTCISQRVHLCAGSHDYSDFRMPLIRAPITIGAGCWVCAEAYVGPGVTIGDRSVVGARSVVTKDMPPDMVCAGNPCRPLKRRIMKPND